MRNANSSCSFPLIFNLFINHLRNSHIWSMYIAHASMWNNSKKLREAIPCKVIKLRFASGSRPSIRPFLVQRNQFFYFAFLQPRRRWSWRQSTTIIGYPVFRGIISLALELGLVGARTQSRLSTATLWIRRNQPWWSKQTTS